MKLVVRIGITLGFLCTVAIGQEKPTFKDYPVDTTFKGKSAKVNLASAAHGRHWRGQLRFAAANGPNFAGHYAIGIWGCGTPCLLTGMIDLKSGKITWPPLPLGGIYDVAFRADSRLLIVNSRETLEKTLPKHTPKKDKGTWPEELYFLWTGRKFIRIAKS